MAKNTEAFKRRLSKVRRRWKTAAALDGLLLVATEALGLLMLFILADAIYKLGGQVRLGMLAGGLVLLAVFFVRHVMRPILLRIPDEQIALYIEERSAKAEGSVISALECHRKPTGGLSGLIAGLLIGDAVRRIDQTSAWMLSNLGRLKKHLLVACVLLAVFAITGLSFPDYARRECRRIAAPWVSIRQEREESRRRRQAEVAEARRVQLPIEIDIRPKGMTILRGKGIEFAVKLSRKPAADVVFHYRFAGADGKEQAIEMARDTSRFGYRLPFGDINESFTYYVTADAKASQKYEVKVYDPLAVRGIELTRHFPAYLEREPKSSFAPSGDVTALAGTRVDLKVVANNPIKSGALTFDDKTVVALAGGAKAKDGADGSFTVGKDGSYTYQITDVYGETYRFEGFFFIKAVPDGPPSIKMVSPKVDMSVHPLCEVTFAAKVTDDFGLKDAVVRLDYYRDGKPLPMPLQMKPPARKDLRNFLSGRVEHVLQLEGLPLGAKVGDMMFYYMEVTDRKGQTVKTDVFFVKLMPFEVAAAWPADPSPPDLPHWDYLWTPDIILLAAAAWNIEQQRGKIATQPFNAKCTKLAGRMEPAMNSQDGLNLLGGKAKLPPHILRVAGPTLAAAKGKLEKALQLLRQYQPGKAAMEMQQAMALAESVNVEKGLQETELAQTPIHTGQPSGGYNQDTVMQQAQLRLPGVMSDSLTAFQQEDNPRHFLPPDYRRALRLKQRTAPLTKELRLAGQIYASQEQLLEMAREQFGHRKLREAAEMSCTNDPAAGGGTRGRMIRVDKRAVPWASMDPRAEMPQVGSGGRMKRPKVEKVKGLKYAKLRDNERAGPPSPHRSQTPGGSSSDDDEDDEEQKDKKKSRYDEQWKVSANDRRPRRSQGGGGGGSSRQQQRSQPGMDQPQQSSSGSSRSGGERQMAARQAALATRTGELARGISRNAEPGDAMGRRAASGLREASQEMRRASDSFRRGDLKSGIAQARRAQQAMRTAMHGMRAAQFGTLGQALAAAQRGAATLAQNQNRISRGTERIEQRIRDLSGETQAGTGSPGQGQPGKGQPGKGQPGKGQPGKGQPGEGQPGKAQPGKGQPGKGQPGKGRPGSGQPGAGRHAKGQQRGGPSRGAVDKAKARDPRIAAGMQGLAGEQMKLSESLKDFEAYVGDLRRWSKEADNAPVTSSLQEVTDGLKQDAVAQKMIDAGVDLSQQEIGSARAAQGDIEAALEKMTARIREAGDMLAGSKTGIVSRTARQAKEVGRQVRRLAGLPQRGSASSPSSTAAPRAGRPGEGRPGPSQPGQGRPGRREDSLARRLAAQQQNTTGTSPTQGQPGPGDNVPGGAAGRGDEIDDLWLRARDLAKTLGDEQLAEPPTLDYIRRRAADPATFRRLFDKVRKAEAGKFADVVTGVGRSLDEVLKETLSAKKLHSERREECPRQFRSFVDAYFESLSKTAAGKAAD